MAYTQLYIINQALNLVGKLAVSNVNDSDASFLMQQRLLLLFPDFLKQASWNFAVAYRTDDTPLTSNFSPEFTYTYQLPANFGRFDRFTYIQSQFGFTYRFVDNLLLSNSLPIQYYYIVNDADYSVLTPDAALALAHLVAAETCMALTQSQPLTTYLFERYSFYFDRAVLSNDMERQIGMAPYNDFDRQVYI